MAQRVKDSLVPQLWHRLQLQRGFDPWPGKFHMLWVQPKIIYMEQFKLMCVCVCVWPFQNSSPSGIKFTSSIISYMASEGKLNKIVCVSVYV